MHTLWENAFGNIIKRMTMNRNSSRFHTQPYWVMRSPEIVEVLGLLMGAVWQLSGRAWGWSDHLTKGFAADGCLPGRDKRWFSLPLSLTWCHPFPVWRAVEGQWFFILELVLRAGNQQTYSDHGCKNAVTYRPVLLNRDWLWGVDDPL